MHKETIINDNNYKNVVTGKKGCNDNDKACMKRKTVVNSDHYINKKGAGQVNVKTAFKYLYKAQGKSSIN